MGKGASTRTTSSGARGAKHELGITPYPLPPYLPTLKKAVLSPQPSTPHPGTRNAKPEIRKPKAHQDNVVWGAGREARGGDYNRQDAVGPCI